jgi:dTDP-4-amino-4,6-dideoxygalactose transaminase
MELESSARRFSELITEERRNLKEVIRIGYLNEERYAPRFEELWADAVDVPHCVATNSGTSALWLAIRSLQEIEGLEMPSAVTTALTYSATVNAIPVSGSKVYWTDLISLSVEPGRSVAAAHDIFVPVHLLGLPSPIPRGTGRFVIEDWCDAHGTLVCGNPVGSRPEAGAFSFYSGHTLRALVTTELAEIASVLKDNGRLRRTLPEPFRFSGLPSMNLKITEFSAAIA